MSKTCPVCGEEMEHWNGGIYECPDCGSMHDGDVLDEMEDENGWI